VIAQGQIWWADLGDPRGSEPGYPRPVLVVQGDAFNRSRIGTVVCVPLTRNLRLAGAPGNVVLRATSTGLTDDSVANVSQLLTIDRRYFSEYVGAVSTSEPFAVLVGIDIVLGR
jgi:mRNA interferase MazF